MSAPVSDDVIDPNAALVPADGDRRAEPGTGADPVPDVDPVLRDAVDLARAAAIADAEPGQVGEYLGCLPLEGGPGPVAVHQFASASAAYSGWVWSVSVARVVGDAGVGAGSHAAVTVDEVVLQPGAGALLPPPWVPWSERLRPDDLGPGDVLPPEADDARLVPAYTLSGDPSIDDLAFELGIGRVRVMSRAGRIDAAERWNDGPTGPDSPMARQAPAECGTCGFYLPLDGSLGVMLGACGNEYSPSDGRVVAVAFGCGAHSESPQPEPDSIGEIHLSTEEYDDLDLGARPVAEAVVESDTEPESEPGVEPGVEPEPEPTEAGPDHG